MADINLQAHSGGPRRGEKAVHAGEDRDEIVELIELLFFAYRDFVSDPDTILETYGFGRAHHRVLHFVGRNPGMRVAELLDILRITKQSLGRVLRELIEKGFVFQREGARDRRQRLLYLTEKGEQLHRDLMAPQITRIATAMQGLDEGAGEAYRTVLYRMIDKDQHDYIARLTGRAKPAGL